MDFLWSRKLSGGPKTHQIAPFISKNFRGGGHAPWPPRLFWIHILYRLATRLYSTITWRDVKNVLFNSLIALRYCTRVEHHCELSKQIHVGTFRLYITFLKLIFYLKRKFSIFSTSKWEMGCKDNINKYFKPCAHQMPIYIETHSLKEMTLFYF